jgi:hypothetical protein
MLVPEKVRENGRRVSYRERQTKSAIRKIIGEGTAEASTCVRPRSFEWHHTFKVRHSFKRRSAQPRRTTRPHTDGAHRVARSEIAKQGSLPGMFRGQVKTCYAGTEGG